MIEIDYKRWQRCHLFLRRNKMGVFLSMVASFIIGFSVGVQRTKKKIRKAIEEQEMLEKQEHLSQIQDNLRNIE